MTSAALARAHMMGRAATIGQKVFTPMVHRNPLVSTFHHYELTHLAGAEELFSARTSIFTRKEGQYTFRYPPLAAGPKKQPRNCPAAQSWRPPEAKAQDAIEALYACAEQFGDCTIPRPGDGTYQSAVASLIFGGLIAKETIYAAWPKMM